MRTGRAASWRMYSPTAFWRRRLRSVRTHRLLVVHLVVLTACASVAAGALGWSYYETVRNARSLASREAPAVQGLAAARLAVVRADWEARVLVQRKLADVAGSGETYRAQLSAADQGLSRIADRTNQDLGTVNGLLASYSNSITLGTAMYRDQSLMRKQKLAEACSLLTRAQVGLVPRLDELQRQQMRRAEATATMGWVQHGRWWLARAALVVVALTLLSALFVLRDRCGRDWNPYLLAAFALTLLAVVPLRTASSAQDGLTDVRTDLQRVTTISEQDSCNPRQTDEDKAKQMVVRLTEAQRKVTDKSDEVRQELADDGWADGVFVGTVSGGLLLVALPAAGLLIRLDKDYGRRR